MTAGNSFSFKEFPYDMRKRNEGESKLNALVAIDFIELLIQKKLGKAVPSRFLLFAVVGTLGCILHGVILGITYLKLSYPFETAQAIATVGAMTLNFYTNNFITHRDGTLKGIGFVKGLLSFYFYSCALRRHHTVTCSLSK